MGNRRLLWSTWLLLVPLLLAAQSPAQTPAPTPAQVAATQALVKDLERLEQRIADERKSWLAFKLQARSDAERAELVEAFPRDEFVGELTELATRAKGTDVAARAWEDVYRIGVLLDDHALYEQSVQRLIADHVTSLEMAAFSLDLTYGAPPWGRAVAEDALRKILEHNPDKTVRAFTLAQLALSVGTDETLADAGRDEAVALLTRIEHEYPGTEFIGMSSAEFVAGARNEIEHLRVGQVAPDFEITDQDGVRFKLSDYRGRVVLLDFWGFV